MVKKLLTKDLVLGIELIVVVVIVFCCCYFSKDIFEALSNILKVVSGLVMLLLFASFYMQYKLGEALIIKDMDIRKEKQGPALNNNESDINKELENESHHHYHFSYSYFIVFIVTIIGLLYTAYSDVFYQQGDPISPIINGIWCNETKFDLDSLSRNKKENTNLVFIIDVSGSVNNIKFESNKWVAEAKKKIIEYPPLDQESIGLKLDKIRDDNLCGLDLIKLQVCKLLIENFDSLKISDRSYEITLFTFGKYVKSFSSITIPEKAKEKSNEEIKEEFKILIDSILGIRPSNLMASETDVENLIKNKINPIVNPNGDRDRFNRAKTVFTIFSDFNNDTPNQDSININKLISGLANKSTYFNLFKIEKIGSKKNKLDFLTVIENFTYKDQRNTQRLDTAIIDLRCANFKSRMQIVFIVTNPFFVENIENRIVTTKESSVYVKLHDNGLDPWQQFSINEKILPFEVRESIQFSTKKYFLLKYTGHAPEQLSKTTVEFEFPNSKELITSEIIFKKGLSWFISFVFCILILLVVIISLVYNIYFIKHFRWKYYIKRGYKVSKTTPAIPISSNDIRDKDDVAGSYTIQRSFRERHGRLDKDAVSGRYTILCKFGDVECKAVTGNNDTISRSFTKYLFDNKKLSDERNIETTPTFAIVGDKTVEFSVSINNSPKLPRSFNVVEEEFLICISKDLLNKLGYDDDISDGVLKRKNGVT